MKKVLEDRGTDEKAFWTEMKRECVRTLCGKAHKADVTAIKKLCHDAYVGLCGYVAGSLALAGKVPGMIVMALLGLFAKIGHTAFCRTYGHLVK